MYGDFYGLSEPPFDLTPDPKFLFLTARLREALSNLRYGLSTSKGLTVIQGDAGTGKTTLIRAALSELAHPASRYVLVSNPTLGRAEFYEFLARAFRFSPGAAGSKTLFLSELQDDVERRFAEGGITGLIIDEAQSMPYELLEEIRLLGNIETTTSKLLNIVLSGQSELAGRLNETSLRQLKQRVALRCELKPLTFDEASAYISGRIRIAGGAPTAIFSAEAVHLIHAASRGIARTINVICDNALLTGFAAQAKPITSSIVSEVCKDFDLSIDQPAPSLVHPPVRDKVRALRDTRDDLASPSKAPVRIADAHHHKPANSTEAAESRGGRELFQQFHKTKRPFSFFG